eukprot:COSAG06_NODE_2448_length_6864_cov_2.750037_2_plen_302_part_00
MASAAPGATGHRLSPSTVLQALHDSAKLAPPPTPGPAAPGGLAGDVQGSWGWSFLLGMGFLLLVYCIVGCCRASAHGRSGLAAIPHSDFWRSLPQLVGDGLRFAMGEEAVGSSERSVAGIAGHDDEYYSAGRRDSAEYVPIAGASVSSHASQFAECARAVETAHSAIHLPVFVCHTYQRRTPGDYGGKGRSQSAASRADRRALRDSRGNGRDAPPPPNWPDEEDRRPLPARAAGNVGDEEEEDEWRNRKTRDTRREEREERERRVKAWVDSGGSDAHWMLSVEDRDQEDGDRDERRLSMDE